MWLRSAKSPAAQIETALAVFAALTAPLVWLGGWIVKTLAGRRIPGALRSYPIAALLWAGAGLGMLTSCSTTGGNQDGQSAMHPIP